MNHQSGRRLQFEQDLAVLLEVLNAPSPLSPQKVRLVSAPAIRRWLLDGHINLLARELGVRLELPAYDTLPVFDAISRGAPVNFYLAGGIQLGGVPIRSMYCSPLPYGGAPPIPVHTNVELYTPGKYLSTKRLYFDGSAYTAEQILLFVANKAGGVHLDYERNPLQSKLEAAASYMTFGNPNNLSAATVIEHAEPGGPCTIVIPPERGNLWSALEIELLSAVQSLLSVHCNGTRLLVTGS